MPRQLGRMGRFTRLALMATLLAAALAGCAERQAVPPPTIVKPPQIPWTAAIGMLEVAGAKPCTAVLVSRDAILTASHCLHQQAIPANPASLQFQPNFGAEPAFSPARGTFLRAQGAAIREGHLDRPEQVAADWALVGISPSVTGVAPLPLLQLSAGEIQARIADGATLFTAGYGYGAMKVLRQHGRCGIVNPQNGQAVYATGMLVTTCIIRIGDSGGPMVLLDRSGKPSLIGIFAGFGVKSKTGLSYAVNTGNVLPYLGDALVSAISATWPWEEVFFPDPAGPRAGLALTRD